MRRKLLCGKGLRITFFLEIRVERGLTRQLVSRKMNADTNTKGNQMTLTDVAYSCVRNGDTVKITDDIDTRTFSDIEVNQIEGYIRGGVDIGCGEIDRVMIRFEKIKKIEKIA